MKPSRINSISHFIFAVVILFAFVVCAVAGETEDKKSIQVQSWLVAGPINSPMPVFHDVKNLQQETFELSDLLDLKQVSLDKWWPQQGAQFSWSQSNTYSWKRMSSDTNGLVLPVKAEKDTPQITYLAAYLNAGRFIKADIEVFSYHLCQVYLDGEMISAKKTSDKSEENKKSASPEKATKEVKLETGKHLLIVKTIKDPQCNHPWNVNARLSFPKHISDDEFVISTNPKQLMTIHHLLDGPKVSGVFISPDGKLAAVAIRQAYPPDGKSESWIEIRTIEDGSLWQTFRGGMEISGVNWAPKGRIFTYTTSDKEGKTLWLVNLDNGTTNKLLSHIENMGGHTWSPDGSFIIYSVTEKSKPNKTGLKRLKCMQDRWPTWRDRSFLYKVNVPEGTRRRLTAGKLSTNLNSISPDGEKLLFTRPGVDYSKRPYSKTQFFVLNINTMRIDSLWTSWWSGSAQWSPDGKQLLVTGGPSMFGDVGINVPKEVIPNDYDTQAYIYDLATQNIDPITKEFKPAIGQAIWSKTEDCIYLNTTDRSYRHLYRYNLENRKFQMIDTGVEIVSRFGLADQKPVGVYVGSGTFHPPKAYIIYLKKETFRLLDDPGSDVYEHVRFGDVKDWSFKNERGVEIEGRVYYPSDFDPDKTYPCIVYYYGGTSPTSRSFGGRYPKELWTANGYVVYVLQPSGATGFGQKFSALHVNDWGKIVADEIINGTRKFLAAHPFVDEERIGCIGASYGGFMTMLLQTKTDLFTTAVAHAGISSISSYWGEGYWGFLYSAIATANSFPWNRKDIYVGQSPLFRADKVTTPILLLHGSVDTNVPPGESIQFYTALKLLGKEVELIKIEGQDHHIMEYGKRKRWTKSILAWFDRWLKDQPEWWYDLYPDE